MHGPGDPDDSIYFEPEYLIQIYCETLALTLMFCCCIVHGQIAVAACLVLLVIIAVVIVAWLVLAGAKAWVTAYGLRFRG